MELIVQLLSGALGGNAAGKLMPKASLGTLFNSILGIVGGGLGGQILSTVLGGGGVEGAVPTDASAGGMDLAGILGNVASGGVGGGVLLAIVGAIKKMGSK